jgi:phage gp46-like protein
MISVTWNNQESRCEIERSGGPIVLTDSLNPAVLLSLMSDREFEPDRRRMDDAERRGWWGDGLNDDPADRTGSLLWKRKGMNDSVATRKLLADDIKQALRWLKTSGIAKSIDVTVERYEPPSGVIAAAIEITSSTGKRWTVNWEATLAATY